MAIRGVIRNAITDAIKNAIREAIRDATRAISLQSHYNLAKISLQSRHPRRHPRFNLTRDVISIRHAISLEMQSPSEMQSHLQVPALELGEIAPRCIRHRAPEVIAGDRLPIMALEVQIHRLAKGRPSKQGAVHPDHLRAVWSSVVISCHQWSSEVIRGHQWSSVSPPPLCCTQ